MTNWTRTAGRGFSLIEVMIVIVIILAIISIVGVNLFSTRDRAKAQLAEVQLKGVKDSLRMFNLEFDRYPTEDEGVAVLWDKDLLDEEADEAKWRAFTDEPIPMDPWGSEWVYTDEAEDEDRPYDLKTIGPDKEPDTDDDISIWGSDDEDGDFGSMSGPSDPT